MGQMVYSLNIESLVEIHGDMGSQIHRKYECDKNASCWINFTLSTREKIYLDAAEIFQQRRISYP